MLPNGVSQSQRASTSCSECSRRKTRCDKEVPCGNCSRRGKQHLCRVPPHVKSKKVESGGSDTPAAQEDDLDMLAFTALKEVDDMRSSIENLRSRANGLEALLLQAFSKLKEQRDARPVQNYSPTYQPHIPNGFASSSTASPAATPSYPSFPLPPQPFTFPPVSVDLQRSPDIFVESRVPAQPVLNNAEADESSGVEGEPGQGQQDLREEEVAASLSLEFMALGRNRTLVGPGSVPHFSESDSSTPYPGPRDAPARPSSIAYDASSLPPNPTSLFPSTASLADVIPPYAETNAILRHALDWTGWYHGCIHAPTFEAELAEFWSLGDERVERANPAWLALFFAQLSSGVKHMTSDQLQALGTYGLSNEDAKTLSKTHQQASLACLYRSNFLEVHQFVAAQTIAILVITGQDTGDAMSNLFPTLLNCGISIAQDLGLHRLDGIEAWEASVVGAAPQARAKSLIAYEMQKRVFWALAAQDWFSIPYRRTTAVQPTQVTSPLPANARDEDLLTGSFVNRPPSEYTVASNTLIWVQFARILQQVYAHIDENPSHSYAYILKLDAQMQGIIDSMPAWMRDGGPTEGLPPAASWVRTTFVISSAHKVLTLHRPFLHRSLRDSSYEPSRKRALDASRTILREGARAGDVRVWTVPYHISAAASVVCLDLFQRGSSQPTLDAERQEVHGALATLVRMAPNSPIAARGVALIQNLLAEEARLPHGGAFATGSSSAPKRKRKSEAVDQGLLGATSLAKKMALGAVDGAEYGLSTSSVAPGMASGSSSSPFRLSTFAEAPSGGYSPPSTTSSRTGPRLVEEEYGAQEEVIPPEFLNIFLGSGFDPLELLSASPGPWEQYETVGYRPT